MSQPHVNPFPTFPHDPEYVNVEEELRRLGRSFTLRLYAHYDGLNPAHTPDIFINDWRTACAAYTNLTNYSDLDHPCVIDGIPVGRPPAPGVPWMFVTSQPYLVVQQWLVDSQYPDPGFEGATKVVIKLKVGYKVTPALRKMKMAIWRHYPEVEVEKRTRLRVAIFRARMGLEALKQAPRVTYADGYPKSALFD